MQEVWEVCFDCCKHVEVWGVRFFSAAKVCWRHVEVPGVLFFYGNACGRLVEVHGVRFDCFKAC